jgi:hypothetical protein
MGERERVLVEDGEIAHDIVGSIFAGAYERGDRVIHRSVYLAPRVDHGDAFYVVDRKSEDPVGVINVGGIRSGLDLLTVVNQYADEVVNTDER